MGQKNSRKDKPDNKTRLFIPFPEAFFSNATFR